MRCFTAIALIVLLSLPILAQSPEGESFFLTGLRLGNAGSLEAAFPLLRQASADESFPLNDYSQFEIGRLHYAAKQYAQAAAAFRRLLSAFPDSLLCPAASLTAGKSELNDKQYSQAIKTFKELIENYPEEKEAAEARFLTGRAYQAKNDWKNAYLAFEATDLYHPLTYYGKQARVEIKSLKRAHRKKLPAFKASEGALFKKGMAYFEQDDYQMAVNIFSRLAREYPKSKHLQEALLMLGRAEMQTNNLPSAISDLSRAAQGSRSLAGQASFFLGLAYGRRGKYEPAIGAMKAVYQNYPDSSFADDAVYWSGYYYELLDRTPQALVCYYDLINKYPYSSSVPAAIWRIGRTYYWNGEFKNASTYLHLAQLYPPGEDSPRCYFFEAKALERQENQAAALEVYKKLASRFDHTYYAYRAAEKLKGFGISALGDRAFGQEDFSAALNGIGETDQAELAAIMEIWEQSKAEEVSQEDKQVAREHLNKYKMLMEAGLAGYAKGEARFLTDLTSDDEKDTLQTKLGEALIQSGNYRAPIRFADRRIKAAVLAGKPYSLSNKIWQLSYPRGYWKQVAKASDVYNVDPYLALAVIREESRFNARAVSRSSARGLMQIMPRTGRGIAKDLDIKRYRTKKLFDPAVNIEMGTYYIANLLKRFDNNSYLALAGYNGGPNKIKRYVNSWYNGDLGLVDIDEFVETIPSRETRLYVQKVMGSYFEYKRLYGRKG